MVIAAAYPFVEVNVDTSALQPVAQRAPGVIALVGKAADGTKIGSNLPTPVDTLSSAEDLFATKDGAGKLVRNNLYNALEIALVQNPKPSKIYGVKVEGDDYAAALGSLEAADDVTIVSLAGEWDLGALSALATHVEALSNAGQKRIGVGMVDPSIAKSANYAEAVDNTLKPLKDLTGRLAMVAARGAQRIIGVDANKVPITIAGDAAAASAAAIAGYAPHISTVLKRVSGFGIPVHQQYSPTEITQLSELGFIPVIDPALIVGESLHFAEGRLYTKNADQLWVDIVRTLDDIDFRLKAGLIGLVGDARITRAGMMRIKTRVSGILGPLLRDAVIDNFAIDIPVLTILSIPESSWTDTDTAIVTTARANRTVDMLVSVTYGPAVHRLKVTLAPKF